MQVIQLLPTIAYGDAVGNDVLAVSKIIHKMGFKTAIYAENIDARVKDDNVFHYSSLPVLNSDDIIIYHFSTGSAALEQILINTQCRKVMIYHNITPAHFFTPYDNKTTSLVDVGRQALKKLVNVFECCLADSSFNMQDLLNAGYTCPIEVLPILIPLADYEKSPDNKVLEKYGNDGWVNLLFVGRVAPNKKQEDVIKAFAYYKRHINEKSRLFLVGNYQGMEKYYDRLQRYVKALNVADVIFTGHTSFKEILAYYSVAHVFLCMSEHEGFCVPLVEAMKFDVPIIAYDSCAVPETLGGAGIVVKEKSSVIIAKFINKVVSDFKFYNKIVLAERNRLRDFDYGYIASLTEEKLQCIIEKKEFAKRKGIELEGKIPSGLQKEINQLTHQFLIEANHEGDYDRAVSFENIPIVVNDDNHPQDDYKSIIKYKLLKPAYLKLAAVSPTLANGIRNGIYHTVGSKSIILNDGFIIEQQVRKNDFCIFVDVTQISLDNPGSGIQRVVVNVLKNLRTLNEHIVPIRIWHDKLITGYQFLNKVLGISYDGKEQEIELKKGDVLFLLDSSWEFSAKFEHICDEGHRKGVLVCSMVHDLFPVQYPELFDSAYFKQVFEQWHMMLLRKSDIIFCNSNSTASMVKSYYKFRRIDRKTPLEVTYFHMGFDIATKNSNARELIKNFVNLKTTFLMVGTVEPRKGYGVVLDAFEHIEANVQLLIIGKNGWSNDNFSKKLASSKNLQSKVLWIKNASDAELNWAYQHTAALIAASKDEGFGLPLIEAAQHGLPIICSNIPIFREVTDVNATYFQVMDVASLTATMTYWLQEKQHPDSRKIKLYSWAESANEILVIMKKKMLPSKVL